MENNKKIWTDLDIMALQERYKKEISDLYRTIPDMRGFGIDVDDKTNSPLLRVFLPLEMKPSFLSRLFNGEATRRLAAIPQQIGPANDPLPVHIEFRPQAYLC